ncbi:MAG: HAD-IA family hydrolase [Geminicoccaceae bacterium]
MADTGTGARHRSPIRLAHVELVIFDCDGVLIDSESIASAAMSEALREFGVEMTPQEAHAAFTGGSAADTRAYCRDRLGITDLDAFDAVYAKRLYSGFQALQEIAGIAELVDDLDCASCVASNSSLYRLTRSLGRLGIWQAFHGHIFSADLVAHPKPAPDLHLLCATELGVEPARCVVIDDSSHGVEAAVAAGMLAIGFVEPNDPRPNRPEALRRHGAPFVAQGSDELRVCLIEADAWLGERHRQGG